MNFMPLSRKVVIILTAVAVFLPIGLLCWQSFLNAPFFQPVKVYSLDPYRFIFEDPDFKRAFLNSLYISCGMGLISVPLGGLLSFLMVRTDMPGRSWIEPLLLIPVFVSPMVLCFGYTVAVGPVGFFSLWVQKLIGTVPWNLYSITSIVLIAGLSHVPHVYLYSSSALRSLGSDVEEAARVAGAGPLKVALTVSLPMVFPALIYSGMLVFFLGFQVFGLALVLGDPEGHLVLSTYLYKLTNKLGVPSYHLMAAVAMCIVAITLPMVLSQRYLLRNAQKYITLKGKGARQRMLPLGGWRWVASGLVVIWLMVTVIIPMFGVVFRAFVTNWGEGVTFLEAFTLGNFKSVFEQGNLMRGVVNTVLLGVIGGGLSVICFTFIGLASHRKNNGWTRLLDYTVMTPRAIPGLLAGLAFLWVFLFFPPLAPFRKTLVSLWLAYSVVWLAYGMRLISTSLLQVGPELEECARVTGATAGQVSRHVTLPLIRYGLLASWLMIFMIFEREYSTGVYLLGPGTEVIGSLLVSLWGAGAIEIVSALSFINILLVSVGMGIALRYGVKLHD
ncbi:MAG TPA: iron ABC transporter permease [Desulfuromonadales bacterium]|nr:iron ABC transporter permease [Desulfuromonadales bacterium]